MNKFIGILLNCIFPGVGTLVIGKTGQGISQIILALISWFLIYTFFFGFIGLILLFITWIWSLIVVFNHDFTPISNSVISR